MAGTVKCSRCHAKYPDDDEHVRTHFGFNKSNEQFKCCIPCRSNCKARCATYYQEHKNDIAEYHTQYYQTHKNNIAEYQKQYAQRKQDELKHMKATGADNKPQHGKVIVPHFTDITGKKAIRLRYSINGMRYEKNMGYNKIGYDKAREELETWFNENVHSNQRFD